MGYHTLLFQDISKINDVLDRPALLVPTGEEIAQMEQASAMASEVTNTVLSQRLQLEEKARSVTMLKKALVGLRYNLQIFLLLNNDLLSWKSHGKSGILISQYVHQHGRDHCNIIALG